MESLKKSVSFNKKKFLSVKFSTLIKVIKPVIKCMGKKHRTNVVTPSTCNYELQFNCKNFCRPQSWELVHVCKEVSDNRANEISESIENSTNEELEKRILYEKVVHFEEHKLTSNIYSCSCYAPFCKNSDFGYTYTGSVAADADICKRGDVYVSRHQLPKEQTLS